MAAAEIAARPQHERTSRRKPFTQWVKSLASLKNKGGEQQEKNNNNNSRKNVSTKQKQTQNGTQKNNPYPQSGHLQRRDSPASSAVGQLSVSTHPRRDTGSYGSLPNSTMQEREVQSNGNRSGAPTVATNPETVYSDAGHSKAATTTTHGGALSSIDGVGADSTFSSPNQSQRSLTTTLTTIQSTSPANTLQGASGQINPHQHGSLNNLNPVMFSHQYPVSPATSTGNTISAIPRHVADSLPNTYGSATANGLLTDNASILTLASSSKRRRRSMDTDASVRAMAPSSMWGGSRESLPLSVLSGTADPATSSGAIYTASQSRPSIGGIASAERASIYSNGGAAITGERNSYYSHKPGKDLGDAKSLRSITNIDARSTNTADGKSMGEVGSVRNYEGSMRSGRTGHHRNDSIPGSIGSPLVMKQGGSTTGGALSRRSSDWQQLDGEEIDEKDHNDENRPSLDERAHDEEHSSETGLADGQPEEVRK